ncbi:MAG: class I SAM-dependent methyltransferase [Candidatus Kaiserbacteria bacterium]|nr:class I SAM-dependent methyltransferase [Candidatus Kaiserbacteria bacterium]
MTTALSAGFAHPPRNVAAFGVEPGMAIADFGAGSGAYVLEIAALLKNEGHIYAVDVQKDLLRRIKNEANARGYKNVEIIWGDLEKEKGSHIASDHIDLVLISNILFQVDPKEPLLVEAMRILKPGGKLVVIDWADSYGGMGPTKAHVVKKDAALALARSAGFAAVREFDAGVHHYGLIFAKS